MYYDENLIQKGMKVLMENLGDIDTEKFISLINREKFDYTKWQQMHFDKIDDDDFYKKAIKFEQYKFSQNAD